MNSDEYNTIAAPAQGTYKEKGSKFLAFAYPVENEQQVKEHILSLKKEYFDARHHCYAYRLGINGEAWRANDDGEPSSTGGKPIFGQLLSKELTNVLVVVVRYFGGIQLGVSGLINAYRSATFDALECAQVVKKTAKDMIRFQFPYNSLNAVMKLIKEEHLEIIAQDFDTDYVMTVAVRKSKATIIQSKIESLNIESLNY